MCVFGNVCVAHRSWTALCQPINEVCKPSSLKKHNIGHTHFHKHGHTQTLLSIQPDSISGTVRVSEEEVLFCSQLVFSACLKTLLVLLLCPCVCVCLFESVWTSCKRLI